MAGNIESVTHAGVLSAPRSTRTGSLHRCCCDVVRTASHRETSSACSGPGSCSIAVSVIRQCSWKIQARALRVATIPMAATRLAASAALMVSASEESYPNGCSVQVSRCPPPFG